MTFIRLQEVVNVPFIDLMGVRRMTCIDVVDVQPTSDDEMKEE